MCPLAVGVAAYSPRAPVGSCCLVVSAGPCCPAVWAVVCYPMARVGMYCPTAPLVMRSQAGWLAMCQVVLPGHEMMRAFPVLSATTRPTGLVDLVSWSIILRRRPLPGPGSKSLQAQPAGRRGRSIRAGKIVYASRYPPTSIIPEMRQFDTAHGGRRAAVHVPMA
jgi:hypothetical protein